MSSAELSAWYALVQVEHEEAEHRQDLLDSGDGDVIVSGLEADDEDRDDDEDGATE